MFIIKKFKLLNKRSK